MTDFNEEQVRGLISDFFKADEKKVDLWITTANPLLGGLSPREMIRIGRSKKLCQFIKYQLSENEPR